MSRASPTATPAPSPDEALFSSADGKPVALGAKLADIIWVSDIRTELGIFPHNISSCSPLVIGDKLYIATSNGVDWSHLNIPAPFAPALVVLDKNTGKVVGEEVVRRFQTRVARQLEFALLHVRSRASP
jgi:hypothetical protein